jgi:hypothetical protein
MSRDEFESEVAAFILSRGITRCPTACVVRTQASISPADREALQRRAAEQELRRNRRRIPVPLTFGKKSNRRVAPPVSDRQ